MADPLYTREKLGAAVQKLATGKGRIKERLNEAAVELVMVDDKVFTETKDIYYEAPNYWKRIMDALTAAKTGAPNQTGIFASSIEQMTEEEAAQVAQSIVSLDSMLESALENR
ncbi:MAG TPA: hypothetical protein VGD94_18890 [Vicinamibacterales bacterium]